MKNEIIERYLRQELNEEELQDFTFQLAMNKELRKEVESNRMIFNTLKTMPEVANYVAKPKTGRLLWLLMGLVLTIGTVILYQKLTENKAIPIEESNEQIERPIAFNPEASFEQLILVNEHRGLDYTLEIVLPDRKNVLQIKQEGTVQIPLKGNLEWNKEIEEFQVSIYLNNWADFENETPTFREKITLKNKSDNNFILDQIISANLSPGSYYLLIETVAEGEPIGGSKFLIF